MTALECGGHQVHHQVHPASNGAAERAVGILKSAMRAAKGSFDLYSFLLMYRTTPHSTTGRTPAELMLRRNIRTKLSLLKPDLYGDVLERQEKMVQQRGTTHRELEEGSKVLARNYRGEEKWSEGRITGKLGTKHYSVSVGNEIWKRHLDQLVHIPSKDKNLVYPPGPDDKGNPLPIGNDEMPIRNDERPIGNDEMPIGNDELPIPNDELPIPNDELPIPNNELPILNDECPAFGKKWSLNEEKILGPASSKSPDSMIVPKSPKPLQVRRSRRAPKPINRLDL